MPPGATTPAKAGRSSIGGSQRCGFVCERRGFASSQHQTIDHEEAGVVRLQGQLLDRLVARPAATRRRRPLEGSPDPPLPGNAAAKQHREVPRSKQEETRGHTNNPANERPQM